MKTLTIEQLAEKLNGKLWVKGDLKRIYLERGYNTKKMSTKTYVFEKDAEFLVSCYIDCPSQAIQWIKSQQKEITDSVKEDIDSIIELFNTELIESKLTDDKKEVLVNVSYNSEPAKWFTESEFYNRFGKYPEDAYTGLPEVELTPAKIIEPVSIERPVIVTTAKQPINTNYGINTKVNHATFGIGEVSEEDNNIITVIFSEAGTKKMMKKFVKLEIIEDAAN